MVSCVVLILISLITNDTEHLFMRLLDICITFWRNVFSNPWPIFSLFFNCKDSLYFFDESPLLFENTFTHSKDCLLTWWYCLQHKVLNFDVVNLPVFTVF